jgi:hypothetical protein
MPGELVVRILGNVGIAAKIFENVPGEWSGLRL